MVLNRIGGAAAMPMVKKLVAGNDRVVAKNLLLTLGDVGGDEALDLIESILTSPLPPLNPRDGRSWYHGAGAVVGPGQSGDRVEQDDDVPLDLHETLGLLQDDIGDLGVTCILETLSTSIILFFHGITSESS